MKSQSEAMQIQNPFGVMDVPDPNDAEVTEFAGRATRQESADDDNAQAWSTGWSENISISATPRSPVPGSAKS
jgi:hypothetical protein